MKVIWICNIILPSVAERLNCSICYGGGWIVGLSKDLQNEIELVTVFPLKEKGTTVKHGNVEGICYYGIPIKKLSSVKYSFELQEKYKEILRLEKPDIVHIFGTESPNALAMIKACEELGMIEQVVISIQGLIGILGRHYYLDLPPKIIHEYTFRDFIRKDNIYRQAVKFKKRGSYEIEVLKKTKHVIGRTDFDKAYVTEINPKVMYHFCNETLRTDFYRHMWEFEKCEKYSIFTSQCSYPIKGFHYLLEAFTYVIKIYPEAHLYTTGQDPVVTFMGKKRFRMSSYQRYLAEYIIENKLEKRVTFLGSLNEQQMCKQFLRTHVFVSASSMENSSNSVGEAMLLGVPTVASDVGGTSNLLVHRDEGFLYQHNEPYILAYYIKQIFANRKLAEKISAQARQHALINYNREHNKENIIKVYQTIISKKENAR